MKQIKLKYLKEKFLEMNCFMKQVKLYDFKINLLMKLFTAQKLI